MCFLEIANPEPEHRRCGLRQPRPFGKIFIFRHEHITGIEGKSPNHGIPRIGRLEIEDVGGLLPAITRGSREWLAAFVRTPEHSLRPLAQRALAQYLLREGLPISPTPYRPPSAGSSAPPCSSCSPALFYPISPLPRTPGLLRKPGLERAGNLGTFAP